MSDEVRFNEPEYQTRRSIAPTQQMSGMSRTVVGTGLATDEKGAQRVILVGAVCIAVLAVGYQIYSQRSYAADHKFVPAYPPALNS